MIESAYLARKRRQLRPLRKTNLCFTISIFLPYQLKRDRNYLMTSLTTIATIILIGLISQSAGAVVVSGTGPAIADSLRIDEVVKAVIRNNDRAAAMRYMEKAAFSKIRPAGAWDDPMLMLGVVNLPTSFNFSEDGMTMKMLGLSQTIPYAGQKGLQSKASRAEAEAARADRTGVEVDLAVAAKLAFLELCYNELLLKDMMTQRQVMDEIAASVAAGIGADMAGRADATAAQADVWRMDADILSMQQEVDAARNMLSAMMGRPLEQTLPPAAAPIVVPIPETVDGWLEAARQNYPPLRKLRYQAEMYAFSSTSAKRMRWPMLKLSANYGLRADTPMEDRMDMLGFQAEFSLPIFSGRRQGDMALSMDAMRQSADADAVQMWREVEADLKTMHNKIRRLSESLGLYHDRIIPADEDAYNSAFAGYSANREMFADLLMRAVTIYRDRIMAHRLAWELARTIAEVEKYTTDPEVWTTGPDE